MSIVLQIRILHLGIENKMCVMEYVFLVAWKINVAIHISYTINVAR